MKEGILRNFWCEETIVVRHLIWDYVDTFWRFVAPRVCAMTTPLGSTCFRPLEQEDELNSLVQTNGGNDAFQLQVHRRWQPNQSGERILCLVVPCATEDVANYALAHFKAICETRKHVETTTRKTVERASELMMKCSSRLFTGPSNSRGYLPLLFASTSQILTGSIPLTCRFSNTSPPCMGPNRLRNSQGRKNLDQTSFLTREFTGECSHILGRTANGEGGSVVRKSGSMSRLSIIVSNMPPTKFQCPYDAVHEKCIREFCPPGTSGP